MNILAINYEYPPLGGGGGVVFEQIVGELVKRHRVTVLTSAYKDLERIEHDGNLTIHRVPVLMRTARATATMPSMLTFWPNSLKFGRKLMGAEKFDIINSHFAVPSAPSAASLARQFGVPHVLSIHGGDIFDPSKKTSPHRLPVVRGLIRRLLRDADAVVAQSRNTAENARKYYNANREIDIIPLGIRSDVRPATTREALEIGEDRFVIVSVGRLVARKNVGELLQVVADLDDPNDLLIVIGDGPKKDEWEQKARELGIVERVRFEGFVDAERKSHLLSAADCFASTSLHEGFGLVFLEAMDHGLPVVAYDHGGQSDFLIEGQTGGLIKFGDHDGFVASLRGLKQDTAARVGIVDKNRAIAKDYYIERCAEQYEQLFERVINGMDTRGDPPAPSPS